MHLRIARAVGMTLLLSATLAAECGSEPKVDQLILDLRSAGAGSGTVSKDPQPADATNQPTEFFYARGTIVTLTAAPAQGSVFTGWGKLTGTGAPPAGCTQPINPCTVVMDDRKSVVANFVPSTGVQQFDGSYSGNWNGGQSSGATLSGTFTLAITNGAVQGDFAPISGSLRAFSGTVSAGGALNGSIAAGTGGCAVTIQAQIATSLSSGISTATGQGSYTLTQSSTCNSASGSVSVTRNTT